MHLTNQIEDSLTNDINSITIDKIRNIINEYDSIGETLEYAYPSHIKERVRKKFINKKTLPNALNCVSTFITITPPQTPPTTIPQQQDYIV